MQRGEFGRVINRSDEWNCYSKKDRLVEKLEWGNSRYYKGDKNKENHNTHLNRF